MNRLDQQRRRRRLRANRRAAESGQRFVVHVIRSNRKCEVQLWDSAAGRVVCGVSSAKSEAGKPGNREGARDLGKRFGVAIKERGVEKLHFNRRQYGYHGRVAAIADGMREAGLQF